MSPLSLLPRQSNVGQTDNGDDTGDDNNDGWWWYSGDAVAVKWAILAGIFVLFVVLFGGAYYHAQRRMKKGLAPLAYHRWLLPRRQRARFEPHLMDNRNYYYQGHQPDGYHMNPYPAPPPAYNPEMGPPPTYAPPEAYNKGASVDVQGLAEQHGDSSRQEQTGVPQSQASHAGPVYR